MDYPDFCITDSLLVCCPKTSFKKCINLTYIFFFSDASLIANYDIKRCYELDITFHYNIPGGLKPNTITDTKKEFSSLFSTVSLFLQIVPQCSGVIITREEITASPSGATSVFFRVPLIFTASSNVLDDQVSSKLTSCIDTLKTNYKGYIDSRTPGITEGDVTYNKYNSSTISDKRSCCGGDIRPPCCAAGSIKVSSTKCGKMSVFLFIFINHLSFKFQKEVNDPRNERQVDDLKLT